MNNPRLRSPGASRPTAGDGAPAPAPHVGRPPDTVLAGSTRAMRGASRSAERTPGRRPLKTVVDGRHRLLDRVGSGGTAAVYRAEDLVLGRNVALKLLHDCFAEDQEFVERFRLEASRPAGLHHRHIVSVFDRGEWDGTHYIAMEYVPGAP